MIKLLIVDDEPLVCVGIQSMLKWADFGIEVVGTARNGQKAMELIDSMHPEIIICDIKMPVLTGLELAALCREKYGRIPVFIMLTSYEDFNYVREAIKNQAVDYLIKLELDEKILADSISRALEILQSSMSPSATTLQRSNVQAFREKFFIRLFNNIFDNDEQFILQKDDLGLSFDQAGYVVATCKISGGERLSNLCANTAQMARETLSRNFRIYVCTLDVRHFAIIFCLTGEQCKNWIKLVRGGLEQSVSLVKKYFGVNLLAGVGILVEKARLINKSYHSGRVCLPADDSGSGISFFKDHHSDSRDYIDLESIRLKIGKAFDELDTTVLYDILTDVMEQLSQHPERRVEAIDTASGILYIAISLLPDGEETMEQVFRDRPDGYRDLYRLISVSAVVEWLMHFRDNCCELLQTQHQNYKEKVVAHVKTYILENLEKRLSLNDVAAVFHFSPNYLSRLFSKYAGEGFVEYITAARISAAKEMLARGEGKIYEISEKLGFESPYYFSKVFKKAEGVSPREYLQNLYINEVE